MSCFSGKPKSESELQASKQNADINKEIKKEVPVKGRGEVIKILLLGTGDCGKSTFAKQLLIITEALNVNMLKIYVSVLRDNVLDGAQTIIRNIETWEMKMAPELIEVMDKIMIATHNVSNDYTEEIAKLIHFFANHQQVKQLLAERGDEMTLQGGISGVAYYFEHAIRFASDFTPTKDDVLKSRLKTTGVIETKFDMEGHSFAIIDVGGQRSERKKWLNCFSSVTSVIFLTAINEYDMVLEEDEATNRVVESLKLWKALTSSIYFQTIPFMLFMNKSDLFKEKLEKVPLNTFFSDYPKFIENNKATCGKTDFEQGCAFFKNMFKTQFGGPKDATFTTHITCAIDTQSTKVVWKSVRETILAKILQDYGMA